MASEIFRNVRLGVFVITGLILLVTGLYFVGDNRNMFGSTYRLYTEFRNVSGLQTGNNVRYAGIDIGTVGEITIVNDTVILVEMIIDSDLGKTIRKNTVAYIGSDGLMGNRLVNLEAGEGTSPVAQEGDRLRSVQPVNMESMLRTLEYTNENVALISSNLRTITENLRISEGTMLSMLTDTGVAYTLRESVDNIGEVTSHLGNLSMNLDRIVSETAEGKGIAGRLLTDTLLAAKFTETIDDVSQSGKKISEAATQLNDLLESVSEGKGSLGVLLKDTAAAGDVRSGISSLRQASEKLDQNMEALKHNFLLRGYFRRLEKQRQKEKK